MRSVHMRCSLPAMSLILRSGCPSASASVSSFFSSVIHSSVLFPALERPRPDVWTEAADFRYAADCSFVTRTVTSEAFPELMNDSKLHGIMSGPSFPACAKASVSSVTGSVIFVS